MEKKKARQPIYRLPNTEKYEKEIEDDIRKRSGKVDPYLARTIRDAARLEQMVEQVVAEIAHTPPVQYETGSTGQQKLVPNPLYAVYAKLHQQLWKAYTDLGLNYGIAPEKVNEASINDADDQLTKMLSE